MSYTFVPLRPAEARRVTTWRYAGDYAIYDFSPFTLQQAAYLAGVWSLLGLRLYSVYADETQQDLVGVFSFTRQGRTVELGLQLRPDVTGHGYGLPFVEAGMRFAIQQYHPKTLRLFVAAFNQRAITVYERAGFHKVRATQRATAKGTLPHWEMTYQVQT